MEQLDKCQYEYPFSLLYPFEKHMKMVDCGTLQDSNGAYYFLSKQYLSKLCSLLKIPVSFLKAFFNIDRNGALTYFSKLDFSKIKFYANQNDMVLVSKNEVYDAYCVLMNQLFTQPFDFWTNVKQFNWKALIIFMICWTVLGYYVIPWIKGWKSWTPPTPEEKNKEYNEGKQKLVGETYRLRQRIEARKLRAERLENLEIGEAPKTSK